MILFLILRFLGYCVGLIDISVDLTAAMFGFMRQLQGRCQAQSSCALMGSLIGFAWQAESSCKSYKNQSTLRTFCLRLSVIRCEPLGEDFRCNTRKFRNDHAQLNRDMNCLAVDNNCAQNQSNTPIQLRLASNHQAVSFHFAQFPEHPSADYLSDLGYN